MESLELARSDRRLQAVRLAITMGLAMLFLAVLLYGLRETSPAYADPGILYVDGASGSDTTACTDPNSPCATIGYALDQAEDFDTILVAGGTYTENLVITKTVTLKGGYESGSWSRSLGRYTTTIDGNQSEVIYVESTLSETTMIDGFTITDGYRGIHIGLSSVAIQNSKIVHNHTTGPGAGMRIDRSYVFITNTLIADNTTATNSGAMSIVSTGGQLPHSKVRINSSTIANNRADGYCNGIFCSLSSCRVVDSIIWGHEGEDFCGHGYGATHSDIEMVITDTGNISEDPRFVDPDNGDYHLQPDSPCIDAGTNESAPETDFEGDPRPLDGDRDGTAVTDMGADEVKPYRIYLPIILKCCPGLDEDASEWDIYREGSPTCVNPENVPTPSLDGNALQFAIAGGSPYGNCHYYRNLPSQPYATQFTYTLSFWFTPTTTCNNQGEPSTIQALEFSMSKWYHSKRYEFALQWQNVGEGAPQWRYWDGYHWVPPTPPITQCLQAGQWYTLRLEGEIVGEQVHYQRFAIDDDSYVLDVTTSPVSTPGEPDRLAIAIQPDGNSEESPYEVSVDKVCLLWSRAD